MTFPEATPCPCGGPSYDACCGPLVRGERQARTAEELMRSRFTAYAVRATDHVFRTWHPRTRPDDLAPSPGVTFTRLEVLRVEAGGEDDHDGVVEFRAHLRVGGEDDVLQERSRFVRRGGRWVYVDGDLG